MIMNRDGHKNIKFFVGSEVEHTPAFSKKTLFVVGTQAIEEIVELARQHKATHIFMGANHSFDSTVDAYWDQTITELLDRGFWVSLDYEAHLHGKVLTMLNKGIWQSRLFVPLLSVRIPNIQMSSPNLTVKIDDVDFKATNPGVWCLHHHELTDSNRFTDWVDYNTDVAIEFEDKPTPMPPYAPQPQVSTEMREMRKPVDLKDLVAIPKTDEGFKDFIATKNEQDLGLDPDAKSSLKVDPEEVMSTIVVSTPKEAAELYADGTTTDPLGKEGSKKPKAKK